MKRFYTLLRYDWPLHFVLLLTNWLPDNVVFIRFRGALARPFFKQCGIKLGIGRNVCFYNPSNIVIGNWVYIAYGCWFQSGGGIEIGDEVLFGPYVVITSSNHTRIGSSWRFGMPKKKKVEIRSGAWIGANCSILAGSIIGSGTVIASNTCIFEQIEEDVLYASRKGEVKKRYED